MTHRIINGKETCTQGFEDIYPFAPNYMNINGQQLHYVDEGEGRPVVMVHGNPTWSFYYRNLISELSHTHRTIVPDHIGCGFSDKPDADSYGYTLENRVSDLGTLIDNLNITEKISLIVHDWGGMIGLAWAMDNLDRVDKIVITNTAGFFLPSDKKIPIIIYTAYSNYKSNFMTWTADAYVTKSSNFDELKDKIKEILAARSPK